MQVGVRTHQTQQHDADDGCISCCAAATSAHLTRPSHHSIATAPPCLVCQKDFANLAQDCKQIVEQGADWLHIDVMVCAHVVVGRGGWWRGDLPASAAATQSASSFNRQANLQSVCRPAAAARCACLRCSLAPLFAPNPLTLQDGHFVPNLTIGAPVVQALRKHSEAFFDCHLMVTHPKQWIQVSGGGR